MNLFYLLKIIELFFLLTQIIKLHVQFCIQSINVYKNEFTRIYIKIKLNINEGEKMCSKCSTYNLLYSQVACHQSILINKNTRSGPMQNKISSKEKKASK